MVLVVEVKNLVVQQVFWSRQVGYWLKICLILANLDEATVEKLPSTINEGVYYGWAQIKNQNEIYKMVTSIGTNPFYNGEKKTIVCEKKTIFLSPSFSSIEYMYLGNTYHARICQWFLWCKIEDCSSRWNPTNDYV